MVSTAPQLPGFSNNCCREKKQAAENPAQNDDPRPMILDSALFDFRAFIYFQGAVNYFAKTPNPMDLATSVLGSLTGGLVFYSLPFLLSLLMN